MVGDDDVKHFDEKDSDGGEVSSPASQDHHSSHHPFAEGEQEEREKREDSSSVQLIAPKKNSVEEVNFGENTQKAATEEEGIVQIEWDMKSGEGYSKSKDISIESSNKVHDVGSSGSSSSSSGSSSRSSSSDDESHVVEKKTVVVETGTAADLVKPIESLSEVVTPVNDICTVGETGNGAVETGPAVDSIKPDNGVAETASLVEPDKVLLIEEVVQVIESTSIDNPIASSVVDLDLQENVEKKLPTLDDNTGVSPVLMGLGSRKKEDEVVSTSEEKASVFLEAKDSATEVHENKLVLSFNAPNVHTSNGAEHIKYSESPEYSDSLVMVLLCSFLRV